MPTIFAAIAAVTGVGLGTKSTVEARQGRKRQKAAKFEAATRAEQTEKELKAAPDKAREEAKKRARRIRGRQTRTILTEGTGQGLTTAGKTLFGQ